MRIRLPLPHADSLFGGRRSALSGTSNPRALSSTMARADLKNHQSSDATRPSRPATAPGRDASLRAQLGQADMQPRQYKQPTGASKLHSHGGLALAASGHTVQAKPVVTGAQFSRSPTVGVYSPAALKALAPGQSGHGPLLNRRTAWGARARSRPRIVCSASPAPAVLPTSAHSAGLQLVAGRNHVAASRSPTAPRDVLTPRVAHRLRQPRVARAQSTPRSTQHAVAAPPYATGAPVSTAKWAANY